MVALNKTYRKTLTPDRSAKDSGLRFYSPEISRWLNRDPAGEEAGVNVFSFLANSAIGAHDVLGLAPNSEVNNADEAGMSCQNIINAKKAAIEASKKAGSPTKDWKLPMEEHIKCWKKVQTMITDNPSVKAMWANFSPNGCPEPTVWCKCCPYEKQGGDYTPGSMFIELCWNNCGNDDAWMAKVMVHEAWHYVQHKCTAKVLGGDCESTLKKEIEAYKCTKQCDSFSTCLYRALKSSCLVQCKTGDDAKNAYSNLDAWYKSTVANFCQVGTLN